MKPNRVPRGKSQSTRSRYPYSIPVKITEELYRRLMQLSKRMGEPQSTVMRMAMRLGLDGLETAKVSDETLKLMMERLDALSFPEQHPEPKAKTGT